MEVRLWDGALEPFRKYAPRLRGSLGSDEIEAERARRCADWLASGLMPIALRLAGFAEWAELAERADAHTLEALLVRIAALPDVATFRADRSRNTLCAWWAAAAADDTWLVIATHALWDAALAFCPPHAQPKSLTAQTADGIQSLVCGPAYDRELAYENVNASLSVGPLDREANERHERASEAFDRFSTEDDAIAARVAGWLDELLET